MDPGPVYQELDGTCKVVGVDALMNGKSTSQQASKLPCLKEAYRTEEEDTDNKKGTLPPPFSQSLATQDGNNVVRMKNGICPTGTHTNNHGQSTPVLKMNANECRAGKLYYIVLSGLVAFALL